uniref:DUF1640 domain-containing protein n=1 Tax=Candidatus Kentrum eta TaxID=2126337 RepID=A0A450UVH7_9GAMM|nr:MAG: hypothetical protein BECKH772A_GA0070896_101058 [Candidatus Kentron sp. H]VFJ97100.1 MAG: hypothetical protein BECKH772B_GA0070898_101048 [Candidatus Kentron sp. H]VFK02724.1 MAG: hypothetical protein BECKH772C_GA0070978_101008 [Candidatus Kentron sp. H]
MNEIHFDTHKYVDALRKAGIKEEHAVAHKEALNGAAFATRHDIDALRIEIKTELRAKLETMGAKMDARMETMEAKMNEKMETMEARIDAKMEAMEHRIVNKMIGANILLILAATAVIKLL